MWKKGGEKRAVWPKNTHSYLCLLRKEVPLRPSRANLEKKPRCARRELRPTTVCGRLTQCENSRLRCQPGCVSNRASCLAVWEPVTADMGILVHPAEAPKSTPPPSARLVHPPSTQPPPPWIFELACWHSQLRKGSSSPCRQQKSSYRQLGSVASVTDSSAKEKGCSYKIAYSIMEKPHAKNAGTCATGALAGASYALAVFLQAGAPPLARWLHVLNSGRMYCRV